MKTIFSFMRGFYEFRRSFTTYYLDPIAARAYDQGREAAHKLTARHFED